MKRFQVSSSGFQDFYHIDCYRIKKPKEILGLGFKEIISNPENVVAIEWASKIQRILPKEMIKIRFRFISRNVRQLTIYGDRSNLL